MELSEQEIQRRESLKKLRDLGIEPYPADLYPVTDYASEMKEKFYRVEDAISATKSAIEEGIVPGGGTILAKISEMINSTSDIRDQNIGIEIIKKALTKPLKQIVENAGLEPSVVLNKVLSNKKIYYGFNAHTEKYEDLLKSGVIDPAKVTRVALENAASIAGMLLTTSAIIQVKKGTTKTSF